MKLTTNEKTLLALWVATSVFLLTFALTRTCSIEIRTNCTEPMNVTNTGNMFANIEVFNDHYAPKIKNITIVYSSPFKEADAK